MKTANTIIFGIIMVIIITGIFGIGNFEEQAVYLRGGNAGNLPYSQTVYVELEPARQVLSGCQAMGILQPLQSCSSYNIPAVYIAPRWQCPRCPEGQTDGEAGDGCTCGSCVSSFNQNVALKVAGVMAWTGQVTSGSQFRTSDFSSIANAYLKLPQEYRMMSQEQGTKGSFPISIEGTAYVQNFDVSCGESTCSPSWSCSGWSECDGLKQYRTCKDGSCGGLDKTESQDCSWDCSVDSDCSQACFGRCVLHQCKYDLPSPKTCGVFQDYPICEWDESGCGIAPADETGTLPIYVFVVAGLVLLFFAVYFLRRKR